MHDSRGYPGPYDKRILLVVQFTPPCGCNSRPARSIIFHIVVVAPPLAEGEVPLPAQFRGCLSRVKGFMVELAVWPGFDVASLEGLSAGLSSFIILNAPPFKNRPSDGPASSA